MLRGKMSDIIIKGTSRELLKTLKYYRVKVFKGTMEVSYMKCECVSAE